MKAKLTYFKPSGKYYSEGEVEIEGEKFNDSLTEVWDAVECMLFRLRQWPGLTPNVEHDFIVSVDVPEHQFNHPHLILPRSMAPEKPQYIKLQST